MYKQVKSNLILVASSIGFLLLMAAGSASAALPAEVATTLTAVQTDGEALIALAWPVMGAIVGGFVIMKLFKRAVSKAT